MKLAMTADSTQLKELPPDGLIGKLEKAQRWTSNNQIHFIARSQYTLSSIIHSINVAYLFLLYWCIYFAFINCIHISTGLWFKIHDVCIQHVHLNICMVQSIGLKYLGIILGSFASLFGFLHAYAYLSKNYNICDGWYKCYSYK